MATDTSDDDTLEFELPAEPRPPEPPAGRDLLDSVAGWGPVGTAAGVFQLVPVVLERDLPLLARWMNDPAVAEFWELAGPAERTAAHVGAQLAGDGRSVPCLGALDGAPMSYWEIYRADLDPLAGHYPVRPHDTGLHLLLGRPEDRGRGIGSALLDAVSRLVLARRPRCGRVLAEPDVRNAPSVAAFRRAGFTPPRYWRWIPATRSTRGGQQSRGRLHVASRHGPHRCRTTR
jgi:RimJ/RimL family protein N-acetyltransferase